MSTLEPVSRVETRAAEAESRHGRVDRKSRAGCRPKGYHQALGFAFAERGSAAAEACTARMPASQPLRRHSTRGRGPADGEPLVCRTWRRSLLRCPSTRSSLSWPRSATWRWRCRGRCPEGAAWLPHCMAVRRQHDSAARVRCRRRRADSIAGCAACLRRVIAHRRLKIPMTARLRFHVGVGPGLQGSRLPRNVQLRR
jgi:hypothetical protein